MPQTPVSKELREMYKHIDMTCMTVFDLRDPGRDAGVLAVSQSKDERSSREMLQVLCSQISLTV